MYLVVVSELILWGVFILCCVELEWFYEGGVVVLFFDCWEEFIVLILVLECLCMIEVYY